MSDLQLVEAYRNRHRNGYQALAEDVLDACRAVQASTTGMVYRCYSRAEKQNGDELKEATKILEKIEPPVNEASIKKLHDVIGVTVVVYYPDHAQAIYEHIERILLEKSIRRDWGPETYRGGYYALHASFRSSRAPHSGLLCELQIKTVLHDAWSAKMHDLTYKPAGAIDHRLGGLMGAVSSQIEGIEQQSITIRNIIQGRHRLESRAFQSYCDALFEHILPGKFASLAGDNEAALALDKKVSDLRSAGGRGRPDLAGVQAIIDEIDASCADAPLVKVGWLLMAKLASGLMCGDRSRELADQVDRFLAFAEKHPDDAALTVDLLTQVPGVFYVAGDLKRAAEYTDLLASGLLNGKLSGVDDAGFTFNRLTYLLELEHLKPSRSKREREKLEADVEAALQAIEKLDEAKLKAEGMVSAVMDSRGLYKIVFGKTPTAVREGIELCIASVAHAEGLDRPIAESCREWRLEAGWRRYFDLSDEARSD
jgi:ppGpp synthetase/RelA/SpoT-type nucleotidyltranferase